MSAVAMPREGLTAREGIRQNRDAGMLAGVKRKGKRIHFLTPTVAVVG